MSTNTPLDPYRVARKIANILNYEDERTLAEVEREPRLIEVMLWLQFLSMPENHRGGLKKFARELIAESADLLGSPTMRAHPDCELSDELIVKIEEEICWGVDWPSWPNGKSAREILVEHCMHHAEEDLAVHLRQLCEIDGVSFSRGPGRQYEGGLAPWYFADLSTALLRSLANWKSERETEIAETEITRTIFRWLRHARSTRRSVMLWGNSRFGKTEAIRAWAKMNAGRARIVETPGGNSEAEFLAAIGRALGINADKFKRLSQLREAIVFIVTKGNLLLIFEEAQGLFPDSCKRSTPPARLTFIRRGIMDAGLPCVFVCMPQSYKHARDGFLKATGFAIEQFDGRLIKTVKLPDSISREDMVAIATAHLPGLPPQYAEHVAEKVAATQRNYLSDVSSIAALARDNAQDAGRALPNLADIDAAILDVLPPPDTAPAAIRVRTPAVRFQGASNRLAAAPGREIAPPANNRVEHSAPVG